MSGLFGRRDQVNVPGKQLGDAVDGVVRDVFEYMAEVGFRVEAVQFGRADEGVHGAARSLPEWEPAKR